MSEKQAANLKRKINNSAEELRGRIKQSKSESFDKVRADGKSFNHPAKIAEMQEGLARRRAEYLKKCDNDDATFRSACSH